MKQSVKIRRVYDIASSIESLTFAFRFVFNLVMKLSILELIFLLTNSFMIYLVNDMIWKKRTRRPM